MCRNHGFQLCLARSTRRRDDGANTGPFGKLNGEPPQAELPPMMRMLVFLLSKLLSEETGDGIPSPIGVTTTMYVVKALRMIVSA